MPVSFLYIQQAFATTTIVTLDGSVVTGGVSSGSSITKSITVGNHSNRALVVVVTGSASTSTAISISSVTGATNSFTQIGTATATAGVAGRDRASIYISLAPSIGTNTITVTFSTPVRSAVIGIYSLYNVEQTTGYYAGNVIQNSNMGDSTITTTITPTSVASFLLDVMSNEATFNTNSQTQTKAFYNDTSIAAGSQYAAGQLPNLNTLTFGLTYVSGGIGSDNAQVVAEIKAAPVPSAPTLHVDTLNNTSMKTYWNSQTGATWYVLNETNPFSGSSWTKIINQSTTSYTVTGLTSNKQYLFQVFAGNSSGSSGSVNVGNYTYPFEYFAKKHDNSTTVAGTISNINASSSGTYNLSTGGAYNFTGLVMGKLQNFTLKDSASMFVTNKTLNINASRLSLHVADSDFIVNCPYNGLNDLELFTNDTDGHHITAFSSPTCYSNNTVKWHVYYTANGRSSASYNSTVRIQVLNNTYTQNPTKFTVNGSTVSTSFVNPWIISNPFVVGTGLQTRGLYFSMNLGLNPAYQIVNYTAGFLTYNQSNPIQFPISFSSTNPSCSETDVTVTFPTTYTLQVIVNYAVEQTTKTYTSIPYSNAGLGYYSSVFKFTNATKDDITMTASNNGNPSTNAVYTVPPNQSCLNTNTNSTIPIIQDIFDFQNGKYGTKGNLGAINLVVLIVLIFSMIGLNRVNEALGMVVMLMVLGGLSYYHIITWPTMIVPAIALVVLIGVGSTKKLPWS